MRKVEDEVRSLEEELLMPAARRSAARLGELLTEDFEEFGSSGRVYRKAEIIATLADEAPMQLRMMDFRVFRVAEGVVHATYRSVRCMAGMPDAEALRSSLWVEQAGQWRMRFHQGTRVQAS